LNRGRIWSGDEARSETYFNEAERARPRGISPEG